MRVLFFYPEIENSFRFVSAPLGIMSICSYLNANGHSAAISTEVSSKKRIQKNIREYAPDIIGVSVISFKYIKNALFVSKTAKEMDIPVAWGGTMASIIPEMVVESGYVDMVSLREGEATWLDLANAFDRNDPLDSIKGLVLKKNDSIINTGTRENLDLSMLPKLDWSLIDVEKYTMAGFGCNKMIHIYWSKGCIGNCTFCYNGDFNCSIRRQRPVGYLIDEMKYLIEHYQIDGFEFTDDLLFANVSQMRELCNAFIENDIHVSWTAYERIGIINDPEDYKLLYKAGCRCLMFGIETGSKRVQKRIHKVISEEKMLSNINACAEAGIIPLTTFMLAFPDETEEDVKETLRLISKFKNSIGVLNLLTPQPGTRIFDELVSSGRIEPLKTLKEYSNVSWGDKLYVNTSCVSNKELYTISNYFSLKGILFNNDVKSGKHFFDIIKNTLKIVFSKSPIESIKLIVHSARTLVGYFTLFLHPKIRKKYSLYF